MIKTRFFALGGIDENGKNCYVLEIQNDLFIINFGTKIPISSSHGIDTLIVDHTYLIEQKHRIKGLFITDIQNESMSAIPWLIMDIPKIPIFCSQFSKYPIIDRIMKYNIREEDINVNVIPMNGLAFNNSNLVVKPIPLAGALPGTIGFSFNIPEGTFILLSNFVDGNLGPYGRTNLEEIKKQYPNIIALFLDSGMANFNDKSINKININKELEEVFKETPPTERIIIGAYDQEMATLHQVLDKARKYNRDVVTYGRSYHQLLLLLKKAHPSLKLPEILDYKYISKHDNNVVIIISGTVERLFRRFFRITENNDVYFKFKENDHFVMIAPPINGLETESTYALDEIARITPKITDISEDSFYRCRPAKQDIVDAIKILKPKYFVPIQGLFRYLAVAIREVVNNDFPQSNCLQLQNGKIITFENDVLVSQKERISQVGDTIIDGFGVGDISKEVLFERENLARDGVIIISMMLDKKTKLIYDNIDVKYIGVIANSERDEVDEIVKKHVEAIYYKMIFGETKVNSTQLQNTIKKSIKKKVFKLTDKEPMIVLALNEI